MPRRLRKDYSGAWHHVMNRGVARRPLFETRRDVRHFLALLARQVRKGDLEVHAYCVMTTHFHLLVRSPRGRLSAAMQQVLDAYARWFNLKRGRDGPLFRGRFVSRLIESEEYWATVLRYIDRNPVKAGMVASPQDYPHGSARHYVLGRSGPPWLTRKVVEGWVMGPGKASFEPSDYPRRSSGTMTPGAEWVAERRLARGACPGPDPLDDLLRAAPRDLRAWMEDRAAMADGPAQRHVLLCPGTVTAVVARLQSRDPDLQVPCEGGRAPWWETLLAGTLRELSGLTLLEITRTMKRPPARIQRRVDQFPSALGTEGFRADVATTLEECLREDYGSAEPVPPGRDLIRPPGIGFSAPG